MKIENTQAPVGQTDQTSGATDQATKTNEDKVDYASYQKLLKEKKAMQEKAQEADRLREMLREKEEQELQKKGDIEELLKRSRDEVAKVKGELQAHQQKYAWKTLTSKIELKAKEMGCLDPSKLIRLMDDVDLKSIQIGEDLSIDAQSLESVLEKAKKENDFLFGEAPRRFANGNPTQTPKESAKSESEIFEQYIKQLK